MYMVTIDDNTKIAMEVVASLITCFKIIDKVTGK